ncbi:MAG: methyltransferase domain-containing protein [Armatimonadia bacterium]
MPAPAPDVPALVPVQEADGDGLVFVAGPGGSAMPEPLRPDLPSLAQSERLASWLAAPRSRLLRRAQIGLRQRVLEIGCGHGVVSEELARRVPGELVCLDRRLEAVQTPPSPSTGRVAADACDLPFRDACFDLVVCQNILLWVGDLTRAVGEIARVLEPGGALVALEPDYGGMMEYPPSVALREVWIEGLQAAGADALVGRKLPAACEEAGLKPCVELLNMPQPATVQGVGLCLGLPLTEPQRARVQEVMAEIRRARNTWSCFLHLPYFLVLATR